MPAAHRLRIAFSNFCTAEWIAGCHYLRNLFIALRSLDQPPEIVLFFPRKPLDQSYEMLRPYADRELKISYARPLLERVKYFAQRKTRVDLHVDSPIAYFLRDQGIDALFTNGEQFGAWFNLPLLAWYTDFQHMHLPEMFSPQDIKDRNQGLALVARWATRVILSSHDALSDFQQAHPEAADKGRVLSFVSQIPASIYDAPPGPVCDQYHLPERFIYLPNQFWKHKNHLTTLEALNLAREQRPDLAIVCTGNTHDYRNPLYLSQDILPLIASRGLHDHLIILGMVPHDHVFALLRQSLAVLQPSFFEGWSSTVEETKSIGKRMLLSDIPVHREQAPPQSIFFDPHDAAALARCLIQVWDEAQPGPDLELEAQAREQLPLRTRAFGQAFVDLVREVLP